MSVRASTELVKNVNSLPPDGKHQILVITLRGFTLGDVVTYLIGLANPNANYQLDSPWSFLNSIDLSRFEARIDPTEQTIALTYRVNLSLAFVKLDTVGVLYDRSSGEGKVNFVLTGRLPRKEIRLRQRQSADLGRRQRSAARSAGRRRLAGRSALSRRGTARDAQRTHEL